MVPRTRRLPSASVVAASLGLVLPALLPDAAHGQTLTTFTTAAAFEAAAGTFVTETFDDATLLSFLTVQTLNGAVSSTRWVDNINSTASPTTRWNLLDGTRAWGGFWDLSLNGAGGGIEFVVSYAGGVTQVVTPVLAGNSPAGTFFGFTSDTPFLSVALQLPAGATLVENHAFDSLRLGLLTATDVHLIQPGAATWATAAHWDIAAVPGTQNQRVFLDPAGGGTVAGPGVVTPVRSLAVGSATSAVTLQLDAAGRIDAFDPAAGANVTVAAGSALTGAGRIDGRLALAADTTITATGDLHLGQSVFDAFVTGGTIHVGTHTVRLDSSGGAQLGTLTTLAGGSLLNSAGVFALGAGDTLSGHGLVAGTVQGATGSAVQASGGTLSLQSVSGAPSLAVASGATLHVLNTNRVDLAGAITLAGASLTHANPGSYQLGNFNQKLDVIGGFRLTATGTLTGSGTVAAALDARAGSVITATGDLTLGSTTVGETFSIGGVRTHGGGFETAGQLHVGSHTVTLLDADAARLAAGSVTTLGAGGVLQSASGLEVLGAITLGDGATLRGQGVDGLRLGATATLTRAGAATFDAGTGTFFIQAPLVLTPTDTILASLLDISAPTGAVELQGITTPGVRITNGDVVSSGTTHIAGDVTSNGGRLVAASGQLTIDGLVHGAPFVAEAGATIVYAGTISSQSLFNSAALGSQRFEGAGRHVFTGTFQAGFADFSGIADFSGLDTLSMLLRDGQFDSSSETTRESAKLRFAGEVTLGGTLALLLDTGFTPGAGQSFDLIDFDGGAPLGSFSALSLPSLAPGLFWDTTALFTTGELFVTDVAPIPEPTTWAALAGLLALAVAAAARRDRRHWRG